MAAVYQDSINIDVDYAELVLGVEVAGHTWGKRSDYHGAKRIIICTGRGDYMDAVCYGIDRWLLAVESGVRPVFCPKALGDRVERVGRVETDLRRRKGRPRSLKISNLLLSRACWFLKKP